MYLHQHRSKNYTGMISAALITTTTQADEAGTCV